MEKLVITYGNGDEIYYEETILCLEYESAEAWLCDFEAELDKKIEEKQAHYNKMIDWIEQKPNYSISQINKNGEKRKEWTDYMAKQPKHIHNGEFVFCNKIFNVEDFNIVEYKDKKNHFNNKIIKHLPSVQTLEEWFEEKKNER